MPEGFDAPVQFLKGIGPHRARLLEKLGIRRLGDLLFHFPVRYYDRRSLTPLGAIKPGETVTLQGAVVSVRALRSARRRIPVLEVTVEAGGRRAVLVWFGQAYREREFQAGDLVLAAGRAIGRGRVAVEEFEVTEEGRDPVHAVGLVPSYAVTEGLSRKQLRSLIRAALEEALPQAVDPLPDPILARRGLPGSREAFRAIHAPEGLREAETARKRFAYEELFLVQAGAALRRRDLGASRAGKVLVVTDALDFRIRSLFPFRLTGAQDRAVRQIRRDLGAGPPMNRLLQGDVGSGKTVVAAYALLAAVGRHSQAALLGPTEILAEQHERTFRRMLEGSKVRVGYLGGRLKGRAREQARAAVAAGEIDLVVGTHALLEEEVRFKDLALVVVDEQHKFGVLQRATLVRKGGGRPHALVMSATPIPRTLALTVYGDLDVTVLDELPPGRRPVCTMHVPAAGRREKYAFIRSRLKEGRQAYFVCPLVEESEALALRAAVSMAEELQQVFREFRVGLLHGRMAPEEKEAAMEEFHAGRIHLLVSTIVIEVGIDVPNASVMAIDHAERYGLSQLHQLRGRVGRGSHESYCILFGKRTERTDVLVATQDGFRIAEEDLRLRGAGDPGGTAQSGFPPFRAARLPGDLKILEQAREDAFALVERDPRLASAPALAEALERVRGGSFFHVG